VNTILFFPYEGRLCRPFLLADVAR